MFCTETAIPIFTVTRHLFLAFPVRHLGDTLTVGSCSVPGLSAQIPGDELQPCGHSDHKEDVIHQQPWAVCKQMWVARRGHGGIRKAGLKWSCAPSLHWLPLCGFQIYSIQGRRKPWTSSLPPWSITLVCYLCLVWPRTKGLQFVHRSWEAPQETPSFLGTETQTSHQPQQCWPWTRVNPDRLITSSFGMQQCLLCGCCHTRCGNQGVSVRWHSVMPTHIYGKVSVPLPEVL